MRSQRVVVIVLFAIVLIVCPIVLSLALRGHAWLLSGTRGYFTAILIGVITNLSVVIPTPAMFPLIGEIVQHNGLFWVVGSYAFGSAVGESSTYFFGRAANYIPAVESSRLHRILESRIRGNKWKTSVVLVLLGALPLPYDLMGLMVGNARYPFPHFFAAACLGKWMRYLYFVPLWANAQHMLEGVSWLSQAAPLLMILVLLAAFALLKRKTLWAVMQKQLQKSAS